MEIGNKIRDLQKKRSTALEKLVVAARAILPVLKDHNLKNVAETLGAVLFELDVQDQEMAELMTSDLEGFIEFIKQNMGGRRDA